MRVLRGQNVTFTKALTDADGNLLPTAKEVHVRISDPTNEVKASGQAHVNLDTGLYEYQLIVPMDATLSTTDAPWKIDWAYVLVDGRTLDIITEFDVVAPELTLQERTILLAEKSDEEYVEFILDDKPTTSRLEIFDGLNNKICDFRDIHTDMIGTPAENGWLYLLKWPTLKYQTGEYLFKLTYKTASSPRPKTEMTVVNIVPNLFWRIYPSLQLMLDKIRKPSTMITNHTKSDYFEYLQRGVALVNIAAPQITGWTFDQFPAGGTYWGGHDLSHFLLSGAALWALQAQEVLYADLNFSFSGQTVNLGYDPSSAIGGQINLLLAEVNEKLPRSKELLLRATTRTAIVGIRQQFYHQGLSRIDTLRRALDIRLNYINQPITTRYVV